MSDFYETYASHKGYTTPSLTRKDVRRFEAEVWGPASCRPEHSFLEIGCGTGLFMQFLSHMGANQFIGMDHDANLAGVVPPDVREHFRCADVWQFLDEDKTHFDRVVLLDVLEHFEPDAARRLLTAIRMRLRPGGKIVIKVPNGGCPWGMSYQYGDLTHRTAFAPIAIRQLADASGLVAERVYGQRQGTRRKLLTDALVHRFLSWALLNPPEFWTANLYAVLASK